MRLDAVAENPLERLLLAGGIIPTPLLDTAIALLLAHTVMAATKFGVFEALSEAPLTPAEVARRCGTDPQATEKLLFALAGSRYLRARAGNYSLAPKTRKWLLDRSRVSLKDAILQCYLEAAFIETTEDFLRTGRPFDMHRNMTAEQWNLYQRGQRSQAIYGAPEVARRTPMPPNPKTMLDIGGAHGLFSAALCRRHPGLRAVIFDLPQAVKESEPRIAHEGLGDRITYRTGNALTEELGADQYDLVFIGNLVHHFSDSQNRDLTRRVARSLHRGGYYVILEIIRSASPDEAGQVGALTGWLFGLASAAGTWSFEEMSDWQRSAGLGPEKPIRLRLSPGYGLQAARKGSDV